MNKTCLLPVPVLTTEHVPQGKSLFCLAADNGFRLGLQSLCRNKVYDNTILACIMISSASLALEEPGASAAVLEVLKYMDLVFTFVFIAELLLKVRAAAATTTVVHKTCLPLC